MAKFGYVKIVSGQAARRIGRFIGWDEKGVKAKVAFGYDTDILPYTNYHFFSFLANKIYSIYTNISIKSFNNSIPDYHSRYSYYICILFAL